MAAHNSSDNVDANLTLQLPDDILELRLLYLKDKTPSYQYHHFLEAATRVCQRWRDIALACPPLWTDIPCDKPAAQVSKGAPLSLSAESCTKTHHTPDSQRCLTFNSGLQVRSIKLFEYEPGELESPAPNLEKCSLRLRDTRLPDNLFAGHAPRLTTFSVEGCGINWKSSIFAKLTTLTVANTPRQYLVSPNEFMTALSCMTRLENLYLYRSFSTGAGESTVEIAKAHLPRLRVLHAEFDVFGCCIILDCITNDPYQCLCDFRVNCFPKNHSEYTSEELDHINRLGQAFRKKCFCFNAEITEFTLLLEFADNMFGRRCCVASARGWPPPQVSIAVSRKSQVPVVMGHFLRHLHSLFMNEDNFRVLSIGQAPLTEDDWIHFGKLDRLETIAIRGQTNADAFLKVFSAGVPFHPGETTDAALLPFKGLIELTIVHWKFAVPIVDDRFPEGTSRSEVLKNTLSTRRDNGMQIEELWITDCCARRTDLVALKKAVKHLARHNMLPEDVFTDSDVGESSS